MAALAATLAGTAASNALSSAIPGLINSNSTSNEREAREKAFTDYGLPRFLAYGNANSMPQRYTSYGGNNFARTGPIGMNNFSSNNPFQQMLGYYRPNTISSNDSSPPAPNEPPPAYSFDPKQSPSQWGDPNWNRPQSTLSSGTGPMNSPPPYSPPIPMDGQGFPNINPGKLENFMQSQKYWNHWNSSN